MKILPIQNSNMNFKGIYKVPAGSINDEAEETITTYNLGIVPSSRIAPEYYYILTPNNQENSRFIEQKLEKDILDTPGAKYWKSEPLNEIANVSLCEKIFNINKQLYDHKENWIVSDKEYDDIPF